MGSVRGILRASPWIERMKSVWLFSDCSPAQLRFIDSLCQETDVPEGKTLLRQGDFTSQFLVDIRGTAVAAVDGRPIAMVEAGSFFGDMALFGHGIQRATLTSVTDMELLAFGRRESMMLFDASIPSVQDKILEVLAERRQALIEHSLEPQETFVVHQLGDLPDLQPAAI